MTVKKVGIILNQQDYKENHKIIYVLTVDGKESYLVMRAKRIKEGLLYDTENLTQISFEAEDKNTLSKAKGIESINYFQTIKNDLKKYSVASYALEVIYRMVLDNENPPILYRLLLEFLKQLEIREDYKMLLLQFRIKLLYFLGINPQFRVCHKCGSDTNLVGLSIANGAVECSLHPSNDNIGLDATKIINLMYHDKTLSMRIEDDGVLTLLSNIIDSYYEKHQYYGIKSKVMLEKLGCY